MCFAIFIIVIDANILVEQTRGKLVYHEFILGFLPFVELNDLIFAPQVHDKRFCIDLVQSHISWATPDCVHVPSILKSVYISESLTFA